MLKFLTLIKEKMPVLGKIILSISLIILISFTGSKPVAANPTLLAQTAPPVTTVSGSSELELARHLSKIGAKIYTSYTCPHCHEQKQLFGQEAFSLINNIECHPDGENAQPQLCRNAGIKGVPTWEIKGKFAVGVQSLNELANLSGYRGSRNFQYQLPY
jgi:glutaredoxin